jgi:KAP family P-loop domain
MAETDQRWDRLTQSAQAAWRWAWTVAVARTGTSQPADVRVDTLDLLAGIALAHLRDNPVSQLLAHFSIPPGAVLSNGGTRRYGAEALLTAAGRIPDDQTPPIDHEANEVLRYAPSAMPPSSDRLTTLSMLFGALLETTNPASTALRTELANRGVDAGSVMRSVREHLGMRIPYPEYLQNKLPYRPPEIQIPPYAPDEPRTRRPPKLPAAEPPDVVGIKAEVDAFAYLIASKTLTPPLAIGLFGDWGSGKSYFLRSLQRRIDELVTAEVDEPPFHRAIAQIEFNAWQYVEGNLWASLLEHLFRNLRRAGEEDADDLLDARRREYLTKITERTAEHRRAVQKRDVLARQHEEAEQTVQEKIDERDRKLAELRSARTRNPFATWAPSAELRATLDEVTQRTGLGDLGDRADELRQALASTSETVRRSGPILGALRAGGWPYALALIVAIALGPAASLLLSQLDVSAVSNVIGSVSALLAGITAYAARGTRLVSSALNKIAEAQTQLDKELIERREQLDQQVREAENALAQTERALQSAVAEEQQLAASVAELETELARITPSSVLAEFVGQRFTSDDYRRHLGVPALVRQDLERLARLIQQRHESGSAGLTPTIPDKHAIDRIVLYIDDLDRCPTHLVIKVLEAVHLLLAFPLFVVVVAVDARWLESSLREHYRQLNAEAAVPADFLEKIFQVPFWVRPLDASVRCGMVRGLLRPNLASTGGATGQANGSTARVDVSQADLPYFSQLVQSFEATALTEASWLEAAKLAVTAAELDLVQEVAPLITATPRAVKRFINIYLLLRSVGRGRGWPVPEQGQLALLLAIATGLPDLADQLLPRLATAEPDQRTLRALLNETACEPAEQYDRLTTWVAKNPQWNDVPLSEGDRWIDLIVRFRFNREERLNREKGRGAGGGR